MEKALNTLARTSSYWEAASPSPLATVSIVVPVYAGAAYLRALVSALDALRLEWQEHGAPLILAEAIFVDDAAIDASGPLLDELGRSHPWVVPIHLSRNFGQHPATIVGILHSSGDWVVTMDEDLQHRCEAIPALLREAVTAQLDIVYAKPASAVHEAAIRDGSSRSFKRAMQWLTDNPNLTSFNSFRLMRGSIARAAASVCSHDTYLDITLCWFTQRIGTLAVEMKDERFIRTGRSGYSLKSLFAHAWRMIFSSQIKILRLGAIALRRRRHLDPRRGLFHLPQASLSRTDPGPWVDVAVPRRNLLWWPFHLHARDLAPVSVVAGAQSSWKTDVFHNR
ncbi:glycosyltransferase [Novosphingobium resinovorum]